jgi:hypothetical protein
MRDSLRNPFPYGGTSSASRRVTVENALVDEPSRAEFAHGADAWGRAATNGVKAYALTTILGGFPIRRRRR